MAIACVSCEHLEVYYSSGTMCEHLDVYLSSGSIIVPVLFGGRGDCLHQSLALGPETVAQYLMILLVGFMYL